MPTGEFRQDVVGIVKRDVFGKYRYSLAVKFRRSIRKLPALED